MTIIYLQILNKCETFNNSAHGTWTASNDEKEVALYMAVFMNEQ